MTRRKPADERRADLLAAGQALFVENGVAATTVEQVTRAAGVSKGLFYVYFRSKEDLLFALQEQFSNELAGRIRKAADREVHWAAKLDACVTATFECYRDLRDLHEVLFHRGGDEGVVDAERAPAHAPHGRAIREILEGGVAAGAFAIADLEVTTSLFFVTMHAFDPQFHGGHPPSDVRLVRATQELLRRGAGVT